MADDYADLIQQDIDAGQLQPAESQQQVEIDYGSMIDEDLKTGAARSMYSASQKTPQQAGTAVELRKSLGLPEGMQGMVERNFDRLSKLQKQRSVDYDRLAKDAPATTQWLSDPVNASVAQDDIENLSGIEQAWGYLKKGGSALASGLPKFNEGIYGAAQFGVDTARTYLTEPLSTPIDVGPFQFQALPSDPLEPVSDFFGELRQGQSGLAGRMMPKAEGITEQGVYSGLQSLGQNLLTLPAAILSGNPSLALGPMVGGVGGVEYGRAVDKGLPYSQAAIYATSQAAVELATERLPMGMLIKDLEKNTGFMKTFAKQLAAELPSEQVATVLQDLNEWAALNPEKPFSEYIAERPNAALQTAVATAVGTGGMVTTSKAIEAAARKYDAHSGKAAKAAQARKELDRLNNLVAGLNLKKVSPSTMAAYAEHVAEGGDVYVDGKDLVNALNQAGIDPNKAAADIPSIGAQLQQSLVTGKDIKIPASEFMAKVAGTDYAQAMLDHIKTDPNEWSAAEAKEAAEGQQEEVKAEVERAIKSKDQRDAHEASAEAVRKQFEEQLNTANRFSKDVNKAYASMISSFYSVTAARLGVTPEDMVKQYPLQVVAEMTQGGRKLDQSALSEVAADLDSLGIKHAISEKNDIINVSKIIVPEEGRNKGVGTKAMQAIIDYADKTGQHVALTPSADFGGNKKRLVEFYKRFGFVENKGKNRAFTTSESMYRPAPGKTLNQDAKSPRAQISFADDITKSPTVISLLKGADLSSFLHESGHFFLEVLADISTRPNAPQSLSDDFDAALKWFGVDRATWNGMTLDQKRPYHEQFARGFEAYAFEGKAPSLALQKLFQRFRAWLLDVYKKLIDAAKGNAGEALDVQLTDEVRAVFDRMLATQEQIEEAQAVRGFTPLFETKEAAEKAGIDWERYQSDIDQAKQDAVTTLEARSLRDMQWFRNAHNREVRRLRRESASLRREARIDARADIMRQPVYQAMQFLTAPIDALKAPKKASDSNAVDPAKDSVLMAVAKLGGINRDAAVAQFGLDAADFKNTPVFGKPILRRNGGKTPDGMAEALAELGYLPRTPSGAWDMNALGDYLHDEGKGIAHYSEAYDYQNQSIDLKTMPDLEANPFQGGRIDRDAMVREYGGSVEGFAWESLGKMLSNDGIHPDLIADMFGFSSGDQMVRQLMEAKTIMTAIEDRTDQIMLERHGDITSEAALKKAADEAIHNEMRAKVLATEANALAAELGQKKLLTSAVKLFAINMLARMRIADIKPDEFTSAESKAAVRFEKARKKGNTKEAALEKRNQLINNHAARLAYETQDEVRKAVARLKQLQKPGSQKAMRGEYLEQLNALLERFDLRTSFSKKAIDRAQTQYDFAKWLNDKAEELGAPTPEMVGFVLDAGVRKHFRELTLEEFRGLNDAVRQLEHLARREQKQYMAIRGMEFEEEKNAILERLRQYHPEAFDEEGKPKPQKEAFVTSLKQKLKDYGSGLLGEFLGLETTFNILEGGDLGLLHESFVKRISDRSNWRTTRLEGVFKKLEPLFDQYSLVEKRQFSTKDIGGDIGIPITREKALGVALLAGNAEGKERLRNYGWSDEQIIKIIDMLDERDKKLAEGIWDIFDNDLWPDLKALNERTTGKAPPKVEATPYVNRLGTWGGGYYKLSYDKRLDERAFKFDADKAISELRNGLGMSGKTQQGSSKERQQGVKMRPRLDFGVFVETVTETVHDIAYREAIADVIRLMNNEDIREALKQIAGPEVFWAMRTRMAEVASAPKNPHGFIENFVSIARRNTIVNLMSGFGTAFQNLTGLIPATGRVNGWLLAREVGKFYSPKMGDMYQFATSKSEYMRHRFTSYEQDLVNAAKKLTVKGSIMPDTATFLALMGWVDRGVSVPVWNAAFAEGMEKYKGSDGLPDEKQAVEYADHIVRQTQGSGRIVDKPGIMTGHPLKTIFTMFHSYFNGQLQQLVRAGLVSKQEAKTDPRKATARVAMAFIVFWVLPALVTEFFKRAPDDEDDEEKLARYAKGLALYPAAMFPIVKDIAPWAWDKYVADSGWARSFRMSPIESAVEGIGRGIESTGDIASGEGDQKDVKNLLMGIGFAAGLPGKLVSDVITGTYDFATGEAGPEAIVLGPEPKK